MDGHCLDAHLVTCAVDAHGNLNIGFTEQTLFPEIEYDKIDKLRGLQITVVTTAKDKKKGKGQGQVKVSQPISQTPGLLNQQMNSQTTSLAMLPPPQLVSNPTTTNNSSNSNSNMNDYNSNNSYQESTPTSMYEGFAPMAANEALGGSGFGASNW